MKKMKKFLSLVLALSMTITSAYVGNIAKPTETYAATASINTTTWYYIDDNTTPQENWKSDAAFDVNSWKLGNGSFGAKNGAIADLGGGCIPNTLLNQYIDGTTDIPVFYFRKTFDVANAAEVDRITGSLLYDDAAIVYINGQAIGAYDAGSFDKNGYGGSNASNPKTGEISYTDIGSLNLKETGNVLAVEIHQGRENSSDIYFDMKSLELDYDYTVTYDINGISLDVGADESKRNLVWYTNSTEKTSVKVEQKPENWTVESGFPAESTTFNATSTSSSIDEFTTNKAEITDLEANKTYLYQITAGEMSSEIYSFSTSDFGIDKDFNFLFAGDPQIGASGNSNNDEIGWTETLTKAVTQFPGTSFLLSAGDQINDKNANEETQYASFLAPNVLKSIPLATNVGNHDSGSNKYSEHFAMPNVSTRGVSSGTGSVSGDYWFMYNGVLIMSINSNNTSTADHKAFLKETLESQGKNARWKVVTFHHSIYSVANHATDGDIITRRNELSPVLSELDIDVVLMGHDHYYTRTYMMNGTTPVVPEGNNVSLGETAPESVVDPQDGQVLYVTANSASGSKYYGYNSNSSTNYVAVQNQSNRETISNIEITENAFTITTYYADGDSLEEMDKFTIVHTPKDEEAPVITLPAESNNTLYVGQAFNLMDGVIASDNVDGVITDKVKVTGSVDSENAGTYVITYEVSDEAGNITKKERTITVIKDTILPTITFSNNESVNVGEKFNAYDGVVAYDDVDGNITHLVIVTGMVNTNVAGQYFVKYEVSDRAGNTYKTTRIINVVEKEEETQTETQQPTSTEIQQTTQNNTNVQSTTVIENANNISVKKTVVKQAVVKKKIVTIRIRKVENATKYQIKYAKNKKFKKAKVITTKKTTYVFKKYRKEKKSTKAYFKVRSLKVVNRKKYYSAWSKSKKVVIK